MSTPAATHAQPTGPLTQAERARLDALAARARGSPIAKVLSDPVRLLRSKWIERRCRRERRAVVVETTTFWGQPMLVALPDQIAMTIYRYGFFEPELTLIFNEVLRPGMTFFDVGSHVGYFSMLAGRLVGPQGQVHAFEPTPSTFEIMSRNVSRLPRGVAVAAAAAKQDGRMTLRDFGPAFAGFNSLFSGKLAPQDRAGHRPREIDVAVRSIDSYCEQTGVTPDLLKIDTEGAEPEVIAGMRRLIDRRGPMISLEVGDQGGSDIRPSREVVDLLVSLGYTPYEFEAGSLRRHEPLETYPYTNLLFRRG